MSNAQEQTLSETMEPSNTCSGQRHGFVSLLLCDDMPRRRRIKLWKLNESIIHGPHVIVNHRLVCENCVLGSGSEMQSSCVPFFIVCTHTQKKRQCLFGHNDSVEMNYRNAAWTKMNVLLKECIGTVQIVVTAVVVNESVLFRLINVTASTACQCDA